MTLRPSDLTARLKSLRHGPQNGLLCYHLFVTRDRSGFKVVDPMTHRAVDFRKAEETARFVIDRNLFLNRVATHSV